MGKLRKGMGKGRPTAFKRASGLYRTVLPIGGPPGPRQPPRPNPEAERAAEERRALRNARRAAVAARGKA